MPALTGEALLEAVNATMKALHARYYDRAPATVRTQLMSGELLAVVMGGVYTAVEKTMIELQRGAAVRDTRSAFQQAMQSTFIAEVERLSGRRVLEFMSDTHVGPDLEIMLFLLAPPDDPGTPSRPT